MRSIMVNTPLQQLVSLILLVLGNTGSVYAEEINLKGDAILDRFVDEALKNNPALKSMEQMVQVNDSLVSPTGALPDPKVMISLSNYPLDSFSANKTPMTGKVIQLSQMFPFPGKRSKMEDVAMHQSNAFKDQFTTQNFTLIAMVKKLFYTLYLDNQKIEITQESKQVLEEFVANTKTKYQVGKGLQQDVLKSQVALLEVEKKLFSLNKMLNIHRAKLSELLGRRELEGIPAVNSLPVIPLQIQAIDMERLVQVAYANSPRLKEIKHQTQAVEEMKALADMNELPNIEAGFQYRIREKNMSDAGTDFGSVFVGMNIPLYFSVKQAAQQKAAIYQLSSQQAKENALKQEIKGLVQMHYYACIESKQLITLYREQLIPQSNQALSSSRLGYEVNKVDFLMLLSAQEALFKHRIAYHSAISELYQNLADLEQTLGINLKEFEQ